MQATGDVSIELDMVFPQAGVAFAIQVRPGNSDDGAMLSITLRAVHEAQQAHFSADSSYALHDFVGGFCRWLGTKRITATHTAQEVNGQFHPDYTIPQILMAAQDICQMLEDKFAAYPHSILS